jgi:GNAT superfamily N-acetyltransferase
METTTPPCPGAGPSALTSSVRIEYLADRPEFIPTLAHWHYQEWASVRPHDSVENRIAMLKERSGRGRIPLTVVALGEGELIGSASLIEHDVENRLELTPWLAGVFVAPERRRQGVGAALVRRVMDEAVSLRIPRVYLYTFKSVSFYADLGWDFMEPAVYRGKAVSIMSYSNLGAKS